jgi:hypothetical protein
LRARNGTGFTTRELYGLVEHVPSNSLSFWSLIENEADFVAGSNKRVMYLRCVRFIDS